MFFLKIWPGFVTSGCTFTRGVGEVGQVGGGVGRVSPRVTAVVPVPVVMVWRQREAAVVRESSAPASSRRAQGPVWHTHGGEFSQVQVINSNISVYLMVKSNIKPGTHMVESQQDIPVIQVHPAPQCS